MNLIYSAVVIFSFKAPENLQMNKLLFDIGVRSSLVGCGREIIKLFLYERVCIKMATISHV